MSEDRRGYTKYIEDVIQNLKDSNYTESDIVDIQQVLTVGVNSDKVSTESDLIWFFNLLLNFLELLKILFLYTVRHEQFAAPNDHF